MRFSTQEVFDVCRPTRPQTTERLYFALMPDEASSLRLAAFAERLIGEEGLDVKPVKASRLHIGLHRISPRKRSGSLLYGAKLAGQAVAAAGLTLSFDAVGRVARGALGLTSSDEALGLVADRLGAMLAKNGIRATAPTTPHILLAPGRSSLPLTVMTPLMITVTGLALLREDFQVLRRWPLNRALRQL